MIEDSTCTVRQLSDAELLERRRGTAMEQYGARRDVLRRPERVEGETWRHGTGYGYKFRRCRCDACKAWNTVASRRAYERRKGRQAAG